MELVERIKYLSDFPSEKKLSIAIFCADRCFNELNKILPDFVEKNIYFRKVIDEFWKFPFGNSNFTNLDFQKIGIGMNDFINYANNRFYDYDKAISETARAINLTCWLAISNRPEPQKTVAGCVEASGEVIEHIYGDERNENGLFFYKKEINWLDEIIKLIEQCNDLPIHKVFFSQIADYKRPEIKKSFKIRDWFPER